MLLEVSLRLAVGYVEALERQLLAGWRGRLLAVLQERPPLEVLADREALASYHRLGRRIFGAGWRR